MNDTSKPTNTDILLHALYTHACNHQEILMLISNSYLALLATARQEIDGFEESYKKNLASQEQSAGTLHFQRQLEAMTQALSVMREALGLGPDGERL